MSSLLGVRRCCPAWLAFVLPALLLNYLGQSAMLLADPAAAVQPFYLMAPRWAPYLLVGLATMAAMETLLATRRRGMPL